MIRLLAVLLLVAGPVLAPVEFVDPGSDVSLPDAGALLLLGVSGIGLALGLWCRRRSRLATGRLVGQY